MIYHSSQFSSVLETLDYPILEKKPLENYHWLDSFLIYKSIIVDNCLQIDVGAHDHYVPITNLISKLKSLSSEEQEKIKQTLLNIDNKKVDITHYLKFLANQHCIGSFK